MGINWGAAGAGFFQGLNHSYEDQAQEQKKFNETYEERVQEGIKAYNASILEGRRAAGKIVGMASFLDGGSENPDNIEAARKAHALDPDKKWAPDELQRFKVVSGQNSKSNVNIPSGSSPMLPGGAEQGMQSTKPSQATQPQAPSMAPSAPAMAPTQPSMPQQAPVSPAGPPQQSGPIPPISQAPAPTGVAKPGFAGQASHYLFNTPLPGQRESIAANRSGALNSIAPGQAAAYAGFRHNQPPEMPTAGGGLKQAPDIKTQQALMQNQAPGADMNAAIEGLKNGDPSIALKQIDSLTERKIAEVEARNAGTAASAEIRANGITGSAFIRSIPGLINGLMLPPEQADNLYRVLTQKGYDMIGASNQFPNPNIPKPNTEAPSAGGTPQTGAQVARPKTKEDLAKIPSGSQYINPADGKTYIKK